MPLAIFTVRSTPRSLLFQVLRNWLCLLLLLMLTLQFAWSQSCSIPGQAGTISLASQPNTFFAGTGNPAAGATSITVAAGTGVNSGIQAGDLLLIIQMQGADINATNTNAYGAGTTAAGVTNTVAFGATGYAGGINGTNFVAGAYEWAIATGGGATFGAGGTINLSSPLVNSYFTRAGTTANGKQAYQVVRVPQYANATLTGNLTVLPWNGSSGGILAIDAAGDLNLAGFSINGTGSGFRGAGGVEVAPNGICTGNFNTTGCQDYVVTIAAALGGSKGEGLVGTPARIYTGDTTGAGTGVVTAGTVDGYVTGEAARGAPGNAGGGGNQHNAGGGGGGGGGVGGNGGNSWNSSVVTFVGLRLGGFGGSTSGNTASRWFMGGGGGAGDIGGNGLTMPDGSGGAGGALVILRASRIVGGGGNITVNGAPGQRSRLTDAGGGGGAGGTVVLAAGGGGLNGALTVNALGGTGGAYAGGSNEQDGAGGGGGGGTLISNVAGATFNATGGVAGASNSGACAPATAAADCGQRAGAATSGSTGYAIVSPGVQVGYECLPNLVVTKTTSTPFITSSTGASASYIISVRNSGGGVRFANVLDWALPPGWTRAATAPSYVYSPIQPLAAGRLASGAETIAIATSSTWAVGATPLSVPAAGSNTLTWSHFAIGPVTNGTPGSISISFVASIPDTATVGTYHNGAGITFLDPTRAAASTRTVAPLASVTANLSATAYSANTAYNNYNGAAATSVSGSNYSGLQDGPTSDDVQLLPDLSITKTAPASATPGTTFTYTLTPRNSGRAIGSQTYANTQATDVNTANVPTTLGSNPITVTDTLPSGVSVTAFNGVGWSCSGTSTAVCTLPNATAYPIAAATNFPSITATATLTAACSPTPPTQTNTAQISLAAGETITANNTGTAVTTPTCLTTNLSVAKTNNVPSLAAGSTTNYTVTFVNNGPQAANNAVVSDAPSTGLNCTTATCAVTQGGASCPTGLALGVGVAAASTPFFGTGTLVATLPANSTVALVVSCSVTATGF